MTHQEKIAYFIADLTKRGINQYTAAPPFWRFAWKLGIKLPPPYFMGFFPAALVTGVPFGLLFGLLWGLPWWFGFWREFGFWVPAAGGAATGILFGLIMAATWRISARKFKLPSWDAYPGS